MPFIAPAIPALIGTGAAIGGGLFGGRGAKASKDAQIFNQMGQKNLGQASDYFSSIMKDPAAATATTTSDLGRQFQQGVNFNARNVNRGGGAAARIAEAPFQLASQAKGQQILAQMGAAGQLGQLGLGAGKLGLGQQGLDLERTQQNRQFWGGIGESIGGFLTSPTGLAKGSILGRIFGPKSSPQINPNVGSQVYLPSQTIPRDTTDLGEV